MSDFTKGVIATFITTILVIGLFNYIGRAWVYGDHYKDQLMTSCQSNGYTYGECFNVIHNGDSKFSK